MTIHTVQPGDTIYSIAALYNVPYTRLVQNNNLTAAPLRTGQSLIIAYPEQTHTVQNGDTLSSVAAAYGVTILQLLRSNPFVAEREDFSIYPDEELVISYHNKEKKISINGFANSFINTELLRRSLPYLTYITILNYRITEDGSLIDIDDTRVIQMSWEYGVAPLMFISALDERGRGSYETTQIILNNQNIQSIIIDNTLSILKRKGYYGLYLGFQTVLAEDLPQYIDFVVRLTNRMNNEGYEVFVSLIPSTFRFQQDIPYEDSYYSDLGAAANYVTLITYQWTSSLISQYVETTVSFLKEHLDYAVTQIPPEKIFIGLTRIAYDWELPYMEGETLGRFLTNASAISLANEVEATIQYDEAAQAPYYYYYSLAGVQHFVWFKDGRTVNVILNLVSVFC